MAVLLLGMVRAFEEYPRPNARTVALTGAGLGLVFGSRILAGIIAPCALAALLLIAVGEARSAGLRQSAARVGEFIGRIVPALALGYLIMGLLWPWSILAPLNPVRAAEYFDKFFEKPWRELYAGKIISVTVMPVDYLPRLFALKLPEIMLMLGLAAILPILVAILAHPAFYNGLRHFVYVVPPFAAIGGLAGAWLFDRAHASGKVATGALVAIFVGGLALPISDMVRLHPYQYTAFNWASGGVQMAHDNYMLDYWGLAFKQAGAALRAKLDAMHLKPPGGRRWTVEICGPQRPAEVTLGPEFETTWDRKRADFAMMLGTFYCRDLTAPILVEINREGIDYARVYDIRGRPVPNLLTEPPP